MPVITYKKEDIFELLGRKLSDEELKNLVESFKTNVEEITENEITIEHTADRADMFGVEGLVRAFKFYLGIYKKPVKYKIKRAKHVVIKEDVPIRPYIACAIIRDVKLTDSFIRSLMNIQEVLHETLGRRRVKVAIGIHDLDKIEFPVYYKQARRKEKMVPLGWHSELTLEEILKKTEKGREFGHIVEKAKMFPVYCDKNGIFSFPPIINSERTRVKEDTKNLFVEVTGTDKNAVNQVLNLIVTNFAERGCRIEAVKIKEKNKVEITPKLREETKILDVKKAEKLLGIKLTAKKVQQCLIKMGFGSKIISRNKIRVAIPPYRVDILHEWDLIEDIAIGYGFNKIEPELPNLATKGKLDEFEEFSNKLRIVMIGLGFQEVMLPVLTNEEDQFDKMYVKRKDVVEIENPVSKTYTCLRNWLLPGLLKFLEANKHREFPQKIFEIGDAVIIDQDEETKTKNVRKLACVISSSKANFAQIRSVIDAFLTSLGINYEIKPFEHPSFIAGRCAEILIGKKSVGFFGEIHPRVLEKWKLEMPVIGFEVNVEGLFKGKI